MLRHTQQVLHQPSDTTQKEHTCGLRDFCCHEHIGSLLWKGHRLVMFKKQSLVKDLSFKKISTSLVFKGLHRDCYSNKHAVKAVKRPWIFRPIHLPKRPPLMQPPSRYSIFYVFTMVLKYTEIIHLFLRTEVTL